MLTEVIEMFFYVVVDYNEIAEKASLLSLKSRKVLGAKPGLGSCSYNSSTATSNTVINASAGSEHAFPRLE